MLCSCLTDKVNHCLSAISIGDFQHLRNMISVGQHRMVSSPTTGQIQRCGRAINHDDLCRRQCLQTLDTNVTQASGSNHYSLCTWIEQRDCLLDSVVCSETRVGQSCNIFRLKARIQLDDCACARFQEVSHTAIDGDTWKCRVDTVHIVTRPASPAQSTGDKWMHNDRISHSHIAD